MNARNSLRHISLIAPLLFLLCSCESDTILTPGKETTDSLTKSWVKWRLINSGNYSFEFQWNCFCNAPLVLVTVRNDKVVDVRELETGIIYEWDLASKKDDYRTIDQLFEMIMEAQDGMADKVTVSFDALHGFPISAFIDYDFGAADEEMGFDIRKVTIDR